MVERMISIEPSNEKKERVDLHFVISHFGIPIVAEFQKGEATE
jgi:hypothetical protein